MDRNLIDAERRAFEANGVALIRKAVDDDWVARML